MPPRGKPDGSTPVEAVLHADKRLNIPTADAKDLVSDRASRIEQVRYPRDPTLDPQLVWKGKDPPYGIKFGSNWQVSTRKRDVRDGKLEDATREVEQIKAFRDTWELGIHSYLSYLRDRLMAARDLLTESGSIFVQIGDTNLHLVRAVLDETFGSENFAAQVSFRTTTGATGELLPGTVDYILWYAKSRQDVKYRQLYKTKAVGGAGGGAYSYLEEGDGQRRRLSDVERANPDTEGRSAPWSCR
ncbi:MAG: DNA methyltransferase [Pseudonocardiales bacterium]